MHDKEVKAGILKLKLLLLQERITKETDARRREEIEAKIAAQEYLEGKDLHEDQANKVTTDTTKLDITYPNGAGSEPEFSEIRKNAIQNQLESLGIKVDVLASSLKENDCAPKSRWTEEDLFRTILVQNAQVQSLLMQNVLGGKPLFDQPSSKHMSQVGEMKADKEALAVLAKVGDANVLTVWH
ncbi:hypothetical protein HDU67_005070 [Dinochytrium kinnereticum]|nr:hypothetical protein HDU67_005070 [Dinochytrium kinnereticum]